MELLTIILPISLHNQERHEMIRSIIEELSEEELEQIFYEAQELEKTGTTGDTKLRTIAESLPNSCSTALIMTVIIGEVYRYFAFERFRIVQWLNAKRLLDAISND